MNASIQTDVHLVNNRHKCQFHRYTLTVHLTKRYVFLVIVFLEIKLCVEVSVRVLMHVFLNVNICFSVVKPTCEYLLRENTASAF